MQLSWKCSIKRHVLTLQVNIRLTHAMSDIKDKYKLPCYLEIEVMSLFFRTAVHVYVKNVIKNDKIIYF
jgi:hypothetical protein